MNYEELFSPIVKHSIHILLALIAQFNLQVAQLDVKTAFSSGDLKAEIYLNQPQGLKLKEKKIWHGHKKRMV